MELPPGPQAFLRRLRLDGELGIASGHFTSVKVQVPVNRLAESSRGENKNQEEADASTVLSNLKGHFSTNRRDAKLSEVSFTEPGTLAQIDGTFNLVDKSLNLRGVLTTDGKLADTTSGFKAVVKGAGSVHYQKIRHGWCRFRLRARRVNPPSP